MTGYRYGRQPGPGEVRKGVQFVIDEAVWEKVRQIAAEDRVTISDLFVEMVTGLCTARYTEADRAAGRTYPDLIGSAQSPAG